MCVCVVCVFVRHYLPICTSAREYTHKLTQTQGMREKMDNKRGLYPACRKASVESGGGRGEREKRLHVLKKIWRRVYVCVCVCDRS